MPDTMCGDFQDLICSDCGEKGCMLEHWGKLVPKGTKALLCGFCWEEREWRNREGKEPFPLGVQPPGIPEDLKNYSLMVTTASKSIYHLGLTEDKNERFVSRNIGGITFSRARVMCLKIGERLVLKPRDGKDLSLLVTTLVDKIKRI